MHPLIIKVMKEQTEKLKKDNKIIVADVPLLFEIHLEKEFDITVLVYADKETQIKRIMKRDKRTLEQAEDIINSQMDIEEKKKKSNYIIYNNGDFEKLTEETEKFLKSLKNM